MLNVEFALPDQATESKPQISNWNSSIEPFIFSSCYHDHNRWQKESYPQISARCILWNEKGQGHVLVNGQEIELKVNHFLILPANHSIEYRPNQLNPFVTGSIYFTLNSTNGQTVDSSLNFKDLNEYFQATEVNREENYCPELETVIDGSFTDTSILKKLCEYIHLSYKRGFSPEESKAQATMLMREVKIFLDRRLSPTPFLPLQLKKMVKYIHENFFKSIQIDDLCKIGHCSKPTVFRLFENYLSLTPHMYASKLKIDKAKDLLLGTHAPVSQISRDLGFNDAFYFSKFFKKHVGVSPSKFRE